MPGVDLYICRSRHADDGFLRDFVGFETGAGKRGDAAGPAADATEQVILDGNKLAEGHSFFSVGATDITDDGRWLLEPKFDYLSGGVDIFVASIDGKRGFMRSDGSWLVEPKFDAARRHYSRSAPPFPPPRRPHRSVSGGSIWRRARDRHAWNPRVSYVASGAQCRFRFGP